MIADADRGLARGDLYVGSGHLRCVTDGARIADQVI